MLGVAGLVAILSRVSSVDPVAAYRHGAVLIIAFFVAAGAVSAGLLTGRPVVASNPDPPCPYPPLRRTSPGSVDRGRTCDHEGRHPVPDEPEEGLATS